jgi:hypothetical protein
MNEEILFLQNTLRDLYEKGVDRAEKYKSVMCPLYLIPFSTGTSSIGSADIRKGGTLLVIMDNVWTDMLKQTGFPAIDIPEGLSLSAMSSVIQTAPEVVISAEVCTLYYYYIFTAYKSFTNTCIFIYIYI